LVLAGCGGKGSSVGGAVTFDGAPVDGGTITFVPEGGTESPRGAQIVGGKYVLKSENGLAPGKYKVEIVWNKKTGKTIPNPNDPGTTLDETKQIIPTKYNSKTELTAEIKSGSNSFDFDLKPGGPVDSGKSSGSGKTPATGD
jgi:hypothetical protein